MENEVIIEEKNQINTQNKTVNRKAMLTFAISGAIISIIVIVVAILYFVKVMPRSVAIHILYPGIALNMLINGFSMLKVDNKKVAKLDFIFSAVVFVIYIVIFVMQILANI